MSTDIEQPGTDITGTGLEPTEAAAAKAELQTVMETADRLSNGQTPDEADPIKVLAGLVRHLAVQTDRLATLLDVTP